MRLTGRRKPRSAGSCQGRLLVRHVPLLQPSLSHTQHVVGCTGSWESRGEQTGVRAGQAAVQVACWCAACTLAIY